MPQHSEETIKAHKEWKNKKLWTGDDSDSTLEAYEKYRACLKQDGFIQ